MVLKRKRNLRIENTAVYSVLHLKDLNLEEIENYIETRDTGMEAEEEKEIHLQNIIKGTNKDIPLPIINQIDNTSRRCFKILGKVKKNRIDKSKIFNDCPNIYIESQEEKEYLQKEVEDGSRAIYNIGDDKTFSYDKSQSLVEFCLKRAIVRYEVPGYEAYTCFRNRIFHPNFKSRRNEALINEKLERMATEFSTLKLMCQILKDKSFLELKAINLMEEAIKSTNNIKEQSRKRRKRLSKLLVDGFNVEKLNPQPNISSLMTNREKMQSFKNTKISSELYLDLKYYNEIMRFIEQDDDFEVG